MDSEKRQLDGVERALLDCAEARSAGVFHSTPLDIDAVLNEPMPIVRRLRWCHVTPVAAAVVLAIGLGAWMLNVEIGHVRDHRARLASARHTQKQFAFNITGPRRSVESEQAPLDLDEDGDIDLADFRQYQLAYAGQ